MITVFTTRLRPGRALDYERAHREIPAQLADAIREAGCTKWFIYRNGDVLAHVVHSSSIDAMFEQLEASAVNARWQDAMAEFVEPGSTPLASGLAAADRGNLVWSLDAPAERS